MSFFERVLRNHVLTNLVFVLVLVVGVLSYLQMPREQDPTINFNWIDISTVAPGMAAVDVEKRITDVLEEGIRRISDVKFVSSRSRDSFSNVLVRFEDIDERTFDKRVMDLRREIQNRESELPTGVESPFIFEVTTANAFPTATIVVVGEANDENLRAQAELVKKDLERINGVDRILDTALQQPELQVEFDPKRLSDLGLSPAQVADTVALQYQNLSAGSLDLEDQSWLVRFVRHNAVASELAEVPVVGIPADIRLGQVANIKPAWEKPQHYVLWEGQPAVMLAITKRESANTLQLLEKLKTYLADSKQQRQASGVTVHLADDQTEITRSALNVMQKNAAIGLGMVLLVVWLFLGFRIAFLTSIGIPFILAGTFWILQSMGETLNVMVLLGVVISLGMLVDDAVVVVESIYYRLQRGMDKVSASIEGVKEVAAPVTTAVLTTMAAFLPLMLLPGIIGKFMRLVPLVVTVSLAISLVEAYWILPSHVLGSRRRINKDSAKPGFINSLKTLFTTFSHDVSLGRWFSPVRYIKPLIVLLVGLLILAARLLIVSPLLMVVSGFSRLGQKVQRKRVRFLHKTRLLYAGILTKVMRAPALILIVGVGLFAAALFSAFAGQANPQLMQDERFKKWLVKTDFFASDPLRLFYVSIEMENGTPLAVTLGKVKQVQALVNQHVEPEEQRSVVAYAGQMFTETAPLQGSHYGQVLVSLKPRSEGSRSVNEVIDALRDAVKQTAGPKSITFLSLAGGPPAAKAISVKVRGDDLDEIRAGAEILKAYLVDAGWALNITDDDTPGLNEMALRVDDEAVRRSGLNFGEVLRNLRLLVDGEVVAELRENGDTLQVRVLAEKSDFTQIEDVLNVELSTPSGVKVPLSHVLKSELGQGISSIQHYNFRRTITIEADLDKTQIDTPQANQYIKDQWAQDAARFPNLNLDFSGQLDDLNESLDSIFKLMLFGVLLMYAILGTQFKSYFQPLMILATVPMAFTGVVVGLVATQNPLSLFTLYGVVALAGIAVNAAIVLISTANARLAAGVSVTHATIYAARRRVIPILITSLTTVAGLFSLATGLGGHSLLWGPVATAIVWGLVVSTVLTLFVIPTIYRLVMPFSALARQHQVSEQQ